MAANIYGLFEVTREPGAVLTENEAGTTVFTETLQGRKSDIEDFYFSLIRRVSTNPEFPGLSLESKSRVFGPGGIHFLNLVWAGTGSARIGIGPTEEPVWVLKRSPSEDPIETHPEFEDFAGSLGAELNNAVFNEESGLFEGFKSVAGEANLWAGVEKFLNGGAVVQKTSVYRQVPSGISTELIPKVIGSSPPAGAPWPLPSGGTRTWMKTDLGIVQRGAAFEVTEEWTLSGQRGWNTVIYPS
jgi:hypothetical protein